MNTELIHVITKRNEHWTHLNLQVIEDERLTWKAKAVHTYLISRPPNWVIQKNDLINRSSQGREALQNALKELTNYGYLTQKRIQDKSTGRFTGWVMEVFEKPQKNSSNQKTRVTGNPCYGKPGPLVHNNISSKQKEEEEEEEKIVSSKQHAFSKHKPHRIKFTPQHIPLPDNGNRNPHKRQQDKERTKALTKIPKNIQPVVDKWRKIAIHHQQGTKSLHDGVAAIKSAISGKLFENIEGCEKFTKPFTLKQINQALDNFDIHRNNSKYLPINKTFYKSLTLASFFYSPYINGDYGLPSIFLECLTKRPRPVADKNPELTALVTSRYNRYQNQKLSIDGAARAATRFNQYWKRQQKKLKSWGVLNSKNLITRWCGWLASTRDTWGVASLAAPGMIDDFERYLRRMQT